MSRKTLLVVLAALIGVGGFFGYQYWRELQDRLPPGIASGNGRIEAKLVDIAAKEPLRVAEISVEEGDLVKPGQVVVQMDTNTLKAQLEEARLNVVANKEKEAVAKATIARSKAQIDLAKVEVARSKSLVAQRAGSQRELDVRNTTLKTTTAALQEEEAKLRTIQQQVAVAQAQTVTIQTRIDDATLRSPILGRVLYKLAEVGEVLAAGGKALTLVNLEDVYMEIFLPSEQAQFTPKQVETKSEREKLMFRVKIKIPEKIVSSFIEYIKTGVRGVGYVKVDPSAEWPSSLQNVVSPDENGARPGAESKI